SAHRASSSSSRRWRQTTNLTLEMPAVAAVPVGSICLAQLSILGTNPINPHTGWSPIREVTNNNIVTQGLYWHLTNSSEPPTYTWTTTSPTSYEALISCYSGVNPTTPIDPGAPAG